LPVPQDSRSVSVFLLPGQLVVGGGSRVGRRFRSPRRLGLRRGSLLRLTLALPLPRGGVPMAPIVPIELLPWAEA
jgi:hypothetical protein